MNPPFQGAFGVAYFPLPPMHTHTHPEGTLPASTRDCTAHLGAGVRDGAFCPRSAGEAAPLDILLGSETLSSLLSGDLNEAKAARSFEDSRGLQPQFPERAGTRSGTGAASPGRPRRPTAVPEIPSRPSSRPERTFRGLPSVFSWPYGPHLPPGRSIGRWVLPHPGPHQRSPCFPCPRFQARSREGRLDKNRKPDLKKDEASLWLNYG